MSETELITLCCSAVALFIALAGFCVYLLKLIVNHHKKVQQRKEAVSKLMITCSQCGTEFRAVDILEDIRKEIEND